MGNDQFFDIILFGLIAAFLVLRLRSVLGRRSGDEGKRHHQDPFATMPDKEPPENNVVQLPGSQEPPSAAEPSGAEKSSTDEDLDPTLAAGFDLIRSHDKEFDPAEMVGGATMAFEMILEAYAHGEVETLRPLLNDEVFANFAHAIGKREKAGEVLEETLVAIKNTEIVEAWMTDQMATITVKFVSDQVHVTRDKEGNVIEGDPNNIVEVTDFWSFGRDIRTRDPNWTLVATRSLE